MKDKMCLIVGRKKELVVKYIFWKFSLYTCSDWYSSGKIYICILHGKKCVAGTKKHRYSRYTINHPNHKYG